MKIVKFLLIIFLLISISGCVVAFKNINEESLGDIRPGMSAEEVTEIAGQPVEKENMVIDDKQCEVWRYPKERFFAKKYNPLGYLYYDILFEEGKVKEWFRAKVYSQPKYGLENPSAPAGTKEYKFFEIKDDKVGSQPAKGLKRSEALPEEPIVSETSQKSEAEIGGAGIETVVDVELETVEVGEILQDSLK